ncbi:hypothetical protein CH373_00385 [Leptospira perolatii]|uniref:Peptidase S1 domain-containing protein n=1 Tax=Leptospira perolatii TaxID=2023191 RepID=A0A2M9ZR49_9LEPT|nr:ricin-type beta-trefoil lectin domain protein [Leptospira perolatii]PJZ71026.1 hypothetical protein CH360_00385 [Leptospira perolatii]PJZ74558.1 hypothetical protein CH373_00385 [Leptospira perolatii]
MHTRLLVVIFLTALGLTGLIFGCQNESDSVRAQSAVLALAQTPSTDPYQNLLRIGDNYVLNGERDAAGIFPYIIKFQVLEGHATLCTGTMVAEHWILTAAHCVSDRRSGTVKAFYTPPRSSSLEFHFGPGDIYIHPQFDYPRKDLALIHLRGANYSIPLFPEKVQFYTDSRVPWRNGDATDSYLFAGYGQGSDSGSNKSTCQEATDFGIKRWSFGTILRFSYDDGRIQGKGDPNTKACVGDSGMPFLFGHSVGNIFVYMMFAVYHGTRANDTIMEGNIIEPAELNWIFNIVKSKSPFRVEKFESNRQWSRAIIEEMTNINTEIKEGNGKCLDVNGALTEPGTKVQIYTCNGTVAQSWTISPSGAIRYRNNLCLDMGSGEIGAQFTVQPCNDSLSQKFAIQKTGGITGPFDQLTQRCMTTRNGSSEDRTPVEFLQCFGGPAQTWSWRTN